MNSPVILITGAGKGIGRALAQELCAAPPQGVRPRLLLVSRTAADLAAAAREVQAAGLEVATLACDVSESGAAARITEWALQSFGRIDCLVNNAGVGRFGDFETLTEDDYDFMMNTNLRGTFLLTQRVFIQMRKQGGGHVVFVTSVAAERPFEQSALYCMSKYGQKGFIEVLRLYGYKHRIRVTNILPGATLTPMWGEVDAGMRERMMTAQDVARAITPCIYAAPGASIEEVVIRPTGGDL